MISACSESSEGVMFWFHVLVREVRSFRRRLSISTSRSASSRDERRIWRLGVPKLPYGRYLRKVSYHTRPSSPELNMYTTSPSSGMLIPSSLSVACYARSYSRIIALLVTLTSTSTALIASLSLSHDSNPPSSQSAA